MTGPELWGFVVELESWAAEHAEALLAPLGRRWTHTLAVAEQARQVAPALPVDDRAVLVAAAYLHDVGYAPGLALTGFHPLDGARHVRGLGQDRLAGLVAHHSCARFEAEERDLLGTLTGEFPDEGSDVTAALAFSDMTTGPDGQRFTLEERLDEVASRYGPEHVVPRSLARARPCLEQAVARVGALLTAGSVPVPDGLH